MGRDFKGGGIVMGEPVLRNGIEFLFTFSPVNNLFLPLLELVAALLNGILGLFGLDSIFVAF